MPNQEILGKERPFKSTVEMDALGSEVAPTACFNIQIEYVGTLALLSQIVYSDFFAKGHYQIEEAIVDFNLGDVP